MGSGTSIEDNILNAIDIVTTKKIADAKYDKTIQGLVVSCEDATIGKYKVRYQDGIFYAYATNTTVKYPNGSSVYVQIPQSDFSKQKTILGTTEKFGINYINVAEGDQGYIYTGQNCITIPNDIIGISSYYPNSQNQSKYIQVIYQNGKTNNTIEIDQNAFQSYIKQSTSLIIGGYIKTNLPTQQKQRGNYGIIFKLVFKDNDSGQEVIKTYILDINKMKGDPYNYKKAIRQYFIYDNIDGENFERIEEIDLFVQGFPQSKQVVTEDDYDIFFSNIELQAANKLTEDELATYALIVQPSKIFFLQSDSSTSTRTINAEVRIKGKKADTTQSIRYYWFVEDATVVSDSPYYYSYGGRGWKCLNNYNILREASDAQTAVYEWLPAANTYTITKDEVQSKAIQYKCVVLYDNTVLSRQFTVENNGGISLSIVSDSGTTFYYDTGSPTLTCLVNNNSDLTNYTYVWSVFKPDGDFFTLVDNAKKEQYNNYINSYEELLSSYNSLKAQIQAKTVLKTAATERLTALETQLSTVKQNIKNLISDNIRAVVYKNSIIELPINTITNYNIYKCSVWRKSDNKYIGTASLTLINDLKTSTGYVLNITNGIQSFKYNQQGIAPTSESLINPLVLKTLNFVIYDPTGRQVVNSQTNSNISSKIDSIKWSMPAINSMLSPIDTNYTTQNNNYIFTSTSLQYKIKGIYNASNKMNNITLSVVYNGITLIAETNFTFIKQGQLGSNGTDYTCKIEPWVRNGTNIPYYPTIYIDKTGSSYGFIDNDNHFNFIPLHHNGQWFRLKLFYNDELVYSTDNSVKKVNASVKWSVVANKYSSNIKDNQAIFCTNESNGTFSIVPANLVGLHAPACVIKAEVTYNGVVQYAYLPIIFSISKSNFKINLQEYTGFNYAIYTGDGRKPSYDTTNPFALNVTEIINNREEEITDLASQSGHAVSYAWSLLGSTCWRDTALVVGTWNDAATALKQFSVNTDGTLNNYQYRCKPIDDYTSLCVTNSVRCIVSQNNVEIGRIIMPVHLMLNQYGNAKLNGWNGNSIQIDNAGGVILAPQVGAGIKNSDNTFTGILMGQLKQNESGYSKTYNGLIGLSKGRRSILLDADTGNATFGVTGQGQIKLIPDGTSQIAGWKINTDFLRSNDNLTTLYANELHKEGTKSIRFDINNKFRVYSDGSIKATAGTIGGWTIEANSLHTTNKTSYGSNTAGAFLGADGKLDFTSSSRNYLRYNGDSFEINIGRNNFFNVTKNDISLGDFIIDDQYGRNAFRSQDGDVGISTDPGSGNFWIWCGSDSDQVEDMAFAVNTGGQAYAYDFCPINLRNINRPFSGYSNSNGSIVLEIKNLWDAIKNHNTAIEDEEDQDDNDGTGGYGSDGGCGCGGGDYNGYTCSHAECDHNSCPDRG